MLLGELLETTLQGVVVHGDILIVSKLSEQHWRETLCWRTVVSDVAGRGRVDPQSVEAVSKEAGFDYVTGPGVDIFAGPVQMQLPHQLVRPGVAVQVEVDRVSSGRVADSRAFVAWSGQDVLLGRQRREIFVVLHSRPGNQNIGIRLVDDITAGRHIAHQSLPVVIERGVIPRFPQFVPERHGHDIGMIFCPVRDVRDAS